MSKTLSVDLESEHLGIVLRPPRTGDSFPDRSLQTGRTIGKISLGPLSDVKKL